MSVRSYSETLDYLYTRLPMFSRTGAAALKPGLDNTIRLCAALGNPQEKFKSVHIAGTNGKGSTSHMLAAIFQKAGYKTGLYTSPHLIDFRERIRIDGAMISQEFVVDFLAKHEALIDGISPSFFEITVAMAFKAFAAEKVDIAIIETGLGGRLDSTNIITPELSIITNISLDHTDLLGNTFAAIAAEKAGIIKENVAVIIGEHHTETDPVFLLKAQQRHSPVTFAENDWAVSFTRRHARRSQYDALRISSGQTVKVSSDLLGSYQAHNIATVLAATEYLANNGWNIAIPGSLAALDGVTNTTGLRGRYEQLQSQPLIIADVAHNTAGLQEVVTQWISEAAEQKHVIIGFVQDKDVPAALSLLPKDGIYYCTAAAIPRALPARDLYAMALDTGLQCSVHTTVENAVNAALAALSLQDALLITGSFFIVGEALSALEARW